MKHFSRLPMLAGFLVGGAACGIVAVGCGSSGTSTPENGGPDATSDATEEGAEGTDSGFDGAQGDASVGTDAAQVDGDATVTVNGEAGSGDAATSDGDAASDGNAAADSDAASVGPDASEAGMDADNADSDAGAIVDASGDAVADAADSASAPTAATFPSLLAAAYCDTIAACCGTSGDAAAFNYSFCYNSFLPGGFKGSNTGANLVSRGNVAFSSAQAQLCLNDIAAADCNSNQITSAEQVQLFQSCYSAYSGTLSTGAACAGTIECAPGNYCLPADGGTVGDAGAIGYCEPLVGSGGSCAAFGNNQALGQTICSYRGSGSDGLFCQNISGDAGTTQLSSSQWTCQPQWANGSECYANQDCSSLICHLVGSDLLCGSAGNWINSSACSTYLLPVDAGGGG